MYIDVKKWPSKAICAALGFWHFWLEQLSRDLKRQFEDDQLMSILNHQLQKTAS
jgi:hypothetical protein